MALPLAAADASTPRGCGVAFAPLRVRATPPPAARDGAHRYVSLQLRPDGGGAGPAVADAVCDEAWLAACAANETQLRLLLHSPAGKVVGSLELRVEFGGAQPPSPQSAAEAAAAAARFEMVDAAMRAETAKRAAARPAPASALATCAFLLLLLLASAACVASLAAAAWRAAAAAAAVAAAAPFYCAFGERLRLAWIDAWYNAHPPLLDPPRPARIDWRPERLRYLHGSALRERRWGEARRLTWVRRRLKTPALPPVTCDDLMWSHHAHIRVGDMRGLAPAMRGWIRASLGVERFAAALMDGSLAERERDRFERDPFDLKRLREVHRLWTDNIRHWQKLLDACGDAG